MLRPLTDFWKRKLAAYLHDPSSKCAVLAIHEQRCERVLHARAIFDPDQSSRANLPQPL